jgi:hypothetical protein
MNLEKSRIDGVLDAYIDLMQKYAAARAIIELQDWELMDLRAEIAALRG